MKRKRLFTTLLAFGLSSIYSFSDWVIEYDFNTGVPEDLFQTTNLEGSTEIADVQNGMLRLVHGDRLEQTSNLWVMLPMSEDLNAVSRASGGQVTLQFKMMQPTVDGDKAIVDVAWGMSNVPPEDILAQRYNSFNAMMRIDSGSDNFELYNSNTYNTVAQLQANEVYTVWLVLDYNLNFMQVYIQGGQWAEQTDLGMKFFRNNPDVSTEVRYLTFGLSSGHVNDLKGIDYMFFDDIAVDYTGLNLTAIDGSGGGDPDPEPVFWHGFEVDSSGNTNTGNWMGWVYVENDPWIWSYELREYVYIPSQGVSLEGGWIYVFDHDN